MDLTKNRERVGNAESARVEALEKAYGPVQALIVSDACRAMCGLDGICDIVARHPNKLMAASGLMTLEGIMESLYKTAALGLVDEKAMDTNPSAESDRVGKILSDHLEALRADLATELAIVKASRPLPTDPPRAGGH